MFADTYVVYTMADQFNPMIIVFAVWIAMALVLLLLGRRLSKPLCVFLGMTLGVMAGVVAASQFSPHGEVWIVVAWAFAGLLVGGLMSWLLFRLWMGIVFALMMAVLLAWGTTALARPWLHQTTDTVYESEDADEDVDDDRDTEDRESVKEWVKTTLEGDLSDLKERANEATETMISDSIEWLRTCRERVGRWWSALPPRGRQLAMAAGLIGLLHGLVLGIWRPKLAASLQTAFAGAWMLVMADWSLVIPGATRETILSYQGSWLGAVAVGLITVAGVVVQWTIRGRKTDK